MGNPKPLTDEDGEVRELTEADFARAVPFSELPAEMQALLTSPRQIVPDAEKQKTRQPAA